MNLECYVALYCFVCLGSFVYLHVMLGICQLFRLFKQSFLVQLINLRIACHIWLICNHTWSKDQQKCSPWSCPQCFWNHMYLQLMLVIKKRFFWRMNFVMYGCHQHFLYINLSTFLCELLTKSRDSFISHYVWDEAHPGESALRVFKSRRLAKSLSQPPAIGNSITKALNGKRSEIWRPKDLISIYNF